MEHSGAGVKRAVDFFEVFAIDVGVDLRGGNIDVTEHFLHSPEVGASFKQMRGERMAEGVGVNFLLDPGCPGILHDHIPYCRS